MRLNHCAHSSRGTGHPGADHTCTNVMNPVPHFFFAHFYRYPPNRPLLRQTFPASRAKVLLLRPRLFSKREHRRLRLHAEADRSWDRQYADEKPCENTGKTFRDSAQVPKRKLRFIQLSLCVNSLNNILHKGTYPGRSRVHQRTTGRFDGIRHHHNGGLAALRLQVRIAVVSRTGIFPSVFALLKKY